MTKELSIALALSAGLLASSFTAQAEGKELKGAAYEKPTKLEVIVIESSPASLEGSAKRGMTSYATCAGCHGSNGEGRVGPALSTLVTEKDVSEKLKAYRDGLVDTPMASMMTPMAQSLSDQDIADLSSYIVTLKNI